MATFKIKLTSDDDGMSLLIVDGYIRKENKVWKLIIPNDINLLIAMFHKEIFKYFGKYNRYYFILSEPDQKIITPIGEEYSCNNYMIYPLPNGYDKGIHRWGVKYIANFGYHGVRSVGVTPIMNQELILKGVGNGNTWIRSRYGTTGSHWDGRTYSGEDWKLDETILVILNMDIGKVEYYRDKSKVKEEKLITNNKKYYFAICVDSYRFCGAFESVNT